MKHIHMIAVCGVGMAPLAVLLKEAGYHVTGSDTAAYPPMSDVLEAAGIEILKGFDPARLEPAPDLVVVGNAVPATNVEAAAAEEAGLERMSLPEAVSDFFLNQRRSLVVAGTHGKTTTTGMLAKALQVAGLDPGYLVGGLVRDLGKLANRGSGEFFVIEGDEYDSAYFDKGPKFLHYQPSAAIVTSLEFDHADIYRDLDHVKSSFRRLAEIMPVDAPLVCCADHPDLIETLAGAGGGRILTYGSGDSGDGGDRRWVLADVRSDTRGMSARIYRSGRCEYELRVGLFGKMNLLNALAVYALCRELGIDRDAVKRALAGFRGAARRQQLLVDGDIAVVDDFAHHPTAIEATLDSLRARFPGRRLCSVFEPRSNTSRRAVFQQRFADALSRADTAVVSAVYAKPNDPLAADEMLSTERLVAELQRRGLSAWTADGPESIYERLVTELEAGDVVVCMSNASFGGLARRLAGTFGGNR